MTKDQIVKMQIELGLSDAKMAKALGVTRQTWRNWRTGKIYPDFTRHSLRCMFELRRIAPDNDKLPNLLRIATVIFAAMFFFDAVALQAGG